MSCSKADLAGGRTADRRPAHHRPWPWPWPERGSRARLLASAAVEVTIIAVLFLLYRGVRALITGQEALALANGRAVYEFQRSLALPNEETIQDLASTIPFAFELANRYYLALHFPVMIGFLLWGFFLRPRAEYLWARNLAVVMTFLALVIHVLFPLAPPRMYPDLGFLDTMTVIGPSAYSAADTVANQYAAMPSLHIGWALLIALVVHRTGPRVVGLLAIAHAATTVTVVLITANHWLVDGLVSAALLVVGLALLPAPGRSRLPRVVGREREPAGP